MLLYISGFASGTAGKHSMGLPPAQNEVSLCVGLNRYHNVSLILTSKYVTHQAITATVTTLAL